MIEPLAFPLHLGGSTSTRDADLVVFFLVGLLGGAHCLGMCGPLVTMYAEKLTARKSERRRGALSLYEVRQHALFNLGRTISYGIIGGLFGLAGALVFDAASIVTLVGDAVRIVSGLAVGSAIVVVGIGYVRTGQSRSVLFGSGPVLRVYERFGDRLDDWIAGRGMIGLGLIHGLLPCPILYPAFLYAFALGSPLAGALGLTVLGLGTFPTLFLYGTVIQSVDATHRKRLHRVLGVVFLLMGWMLISHGLALLGIHVPHLELPIYQPL